MLGHLTIWQVLALTIVNSVGLLLVGTIFYEERLKTLQANKKLALSFRSALIASGMMLVMSLDAGIYFWISSGNIRSALIAIPMAVCGLPFMFIVSLAGSYIQMGYRDKMQDMIYSIARREAEKQSHTKN